MAFLLKVFSGSDRLKEKQKSADVVSETFRAELVRYVHSKLSVNIFRHQSAAMSVVIYFFGCTSDLPLSWFLLTEFFLCDEFRLTLSKRHDSIGTKKRVGGRCKTAFVLERAQ